jgi:hypothetical protein
MRRQQIVANEHWGGYLAIDTAPPFSGMNSASGASRAVQAAMPPPVRSISRAGCRRWFLLLHLFIKQLQKPSLVFESGSNLGKIESLKIVPLHAIIRHALKVVGKHKSFSFGTVVINIAQYLP